MGLRLGLLRLIVLAAIICTFTFSSANAATDIVAAACRRRPELPYCGKASVDDKRRKEPNDPFSSKFELNDEDESNEAASFDGEGEERTTYRPLPRRQLRTTEPPPRQDILYTIFPTLQKDHNPNHYCPNNQYTFQLTCRPGRKLRYDLQMFCQEFSDICGIPNLLLYPSQRPNPDEGRPVGYGQKQKNGNVGTGRSFGLGLGAIPGFEVVVSQGADIGHENLPLIDQIGGIMVNQGTDLGVMGQRIGKGPARTMNALTHGIPTFGLGGAPESNADRKANQELLRSFGIPAVPGLGKLLAKSLGGNRKKSQQLQYEPGYDAINPRAPLALGKTDRDAVSLPAGMGDIEVLRGTGFGLGK